MSYIKLLLFFQTGPFQVLEASPTAVMIEQDGIHNTLAVT